ncbi:MAG TPA: TIGR02266 family protein, partial [Polyangia bacterium]
MRTPITLKIKFKSSNLDQFIERYSVDVSRGGIFIRTKEPLPVGTQLRFEFQLQDASSLIAGDGTVVWIREHDPARQGVAPGMGVRFDKLAADSQKVLDRILSEKQKRGDAQLESRFDAGVRASASASGTLSSSGARVAGHNDFSGGDSRTATPLPGAIPGLAAPDDEFGNESTRVMQNELVQSLADRTRGQASEDPANAFSEPEPTRKASVEELKLAVQGSALEKEPEKKPEAKVEVASEPKKEDAKPIAVVELKKEEVRVETAKPIIVVEEKKPEPVVEAKKEEKKAEPVAKDAKHKKNKNKQDERRAEAKNGEAKKSEDKKSDEKKADAGKSVKPAEKDKAATAAPYPKGATSEPARKRSPLPLFAGVAVVALVGGYTVFRNKGDDDQAKPAAEQQQAAAQPEQPKSEPPKVAQNDTPKPTESPAAAEAKGDKPAAAVTPSEQPNPALPAKEPTAAAAQKPAGLTVAVASDP